MKYCLNCRVSRFKCSIKEKTIAWISQINSVFVERDSSKKKTKLVFKTKAMTEATIKPFWKLLLNFLCWVSNVRALKIPN